MKRPHFCGLSVFFAFWGFFGGFRGVFFLGTPEWVKSAVFSILPDPGCPGDPELVEIQNIFDFAGPRVPSWGTPRLGPILIVWCLGTL